jgi:hypothetical protein
MQLRHDSGRLVSQISVFSKVEPLLKRVQVVEDIRKDKVEKRPQFSEIVLYKSKLSE